MPFWINIDEMTDCQEYVLSELKEVTEQNSLTKMNQRFTMIAEILPVLSFEKERNFVIAGVSERYGVSKQTLRSYLWRYLVFQDKWNLKGHFPPDNRIKERLQKLDDSYKEVYSVVPDFFDKYEDLLKRANKIIHKQGFDVFYSFKEVNQKRKANTSEEFFLEFLIYAIGRTIIMYIILDPLSLALCDERLAMQDTFYANN
jgi:hypothetical protein